MLRLKSLLKSDITNNALLTPDENGFIISDEDMRTDRGGIFTAGDCRKKKIRQITTAMADGTTAAFSACKYVDELNK